MLSQTGEDFHELEKHAKITLLIGTCRTPPHGDKE